MVLCNASRHINAIKKWGNKLMDTDRLFILDVSNTKIEEVLSYDCHGFITKKDTGVLWKRIINVIRRLAKYIPIIPNIIVGLFWRDFLLNLECFDPDIIDFRINNLDKHALKIADRFNNAVIIYKDSVIHNKAKDSRWRKYNSGKKVSIVLPVFNGAKYLRKSIETCLNQTHKNIELVIVDDGSTDDTPDIIAEYAMNEPRIKCIRKNHNMGLSWALNAGFSNATGELLTWTSHDNYYEYNAIEALVRYLCTWEDVDFVYSACHTIDSDGKVSKIIAYKFMPWFLVKGNTVGAYFMYRRKVYEKIGNYREEWMYVEDYEYWVRIYKGGHKMVCLHLPLYYYRYHISTLSNKMKNEGIKTTNMFKRVQNQYFND